jgi:hypothetical protein
MSTSKEHGSSLEKKKCIKVCKLGSENGYFCRSSMKNDSDL